MNSHNLRIYVTTSHLSTIFLSMLARETKSNNTSDVLFIDIGTRRDEQVELIREASGLHQWDLFHDFATGVDKDHDFSPSRLKKFRRKLRSSFLFKRWYGLFLRKHLDRKTRLYVEEIKKLIAPLRQPESSIQLFGMSQTYLNQPLQQLFPGLPIHFLEHGIGDYIYSKEEKVHGATMFALFAEPYKKYLVSKGFAADWIFPIPHINTFRTVAKELLVKHEHLLHLSELPESELPVVFILLEAVDLYNVPLNFWKDYLEHICKQLTSPEKFHYVLKAHPLQSAVSMEHTREFFEERNYNYLLLENGSYCGLSAEVIFEHWAAKTKHVFCLFSSGCFYISELYKIPEIQFWYSTQFMSGYLKDSPKPFKAHFEELRPLIEDVFAGRCKTY